MRKITENISFVVIVILITCLFLSFAVYYNYIAFPLEKEYHHEEEVPLLNEGAYERVLEKWEDRRDSLDGEKNIFR